MSSSIVLNGLSEQMKDIWKNVESDKKDKFEQEYMKIFAEVWRESVGIYNKELVNQDTLPAENAQSKEPQLETVTEAKMEEAEIRHEATLIAVTAKRKEYPARIAAYLGKRRRLQKNTAEVMKVDLGLKTPKEVHDRVLSMNDDVILDNKTSSSLSKSIQYLQAHIQRLNNLADVATVLTNSQSDSDGVSLSSKSL